MNIYGFYGEHLDNQTEWDWLSIRSDDGLNRRWRSNTVHPFLFSSETISKGRTQIVVQLEQFIANYVLPTFFIWSPTLSWAIHGQNMGYSENEMTPVSETIKIGSENETVNWTFVRINLLFCLKKTNKKIPHHSWLINYCKNVRDSFMVHFPCSFSFQVRRFLRFTILNFLKNNPPNKLFWDLFKNLEQNYFEAFLRLYAQNEGFNTSRRFEIKSYHLGQIRWEWLRFGQAILRDSPVEYNLTCSP